MDPDSNPGYCGAAGDCLGANAGTACANYEACVEGQCRPLQIAYSCKDILDFGLSTGDGVYQVDLDGPGPSSPVDVYCDMTTDGGGWTLIVLTNGNVDGHPNVPFAAAKDEPVNINGTFSADLNAFDYFMGTNFWNLAGSSNKQMLWKVGTDASNILDVVRATFNVYGGGERIHWEGYVALQGGIPNIDYQNEGFLHAMDQATAGAPFPCTEEAQPGVGLHGPWFYTACSNASPWCTGHGDCGGLPVRMQWRNQGSYTTATSPSCSNHGEIYVR